jgi:predicted transcriptional regulator
MKEINKTSSEYNSVFNKHRKQALKVAKEESAEFLNAKEDLDEILEEIKDLERKRLRLNKIYDDVVKTLDDKIVQEYGYIDPNIRLNEIKQALN